MKCPVDDAELRITDRQGVEIDYCPVCRGVWLDRGELDKIIQRNARDLDRDDDDRDRDRARRPEPVRTERRDDDDYEDRDRGDYRDPKRKRRRSLLEDLFDFD